MIHHYALFNTFNVMALYSPACSTISCSTPHRLVPEIEPKVNFKYRYACGQYRKQFGIRRWRLS